jgi:hypothetical protein
MDLPIIFQLPNDCIGHESEIESSVKKRKLLSGADCLGISSAQTWVSSHVWEVSSFQHVPHSALFSRCSLAVHHGGAGTVHAAARAAVPQLVLPIAFDQRTSVSNLNFVVFCRVLPSKLDFNLPVPVPVLCCAVLLCQHYGPLESWNLNLAPSFL